MNTPDRKRLAAMPALRALNSIQILRGVAAVLVMFYHYAHYLKATFPGHDIGYHLFAGGYAGVDIFFYISGFVIVYSTERAGNANPIDFSIRRFFRVVPLAQVATLVYFAILFTRPPARLLWQSLFFIPRGYIDPPKFGFPVVPQEWTLAYELLFYGIFAAVLVFTQRRRVAAASIAIVAVVVASQLFLGGPFSLRPNNVYPSPEYHAVVPAEYLGLVGNPIMLEFVVGMFLAVAYLRFENSLRSAKWAIAERIVGFPLVGLFIASYFSRLDPGNGLLDKGAGAFCLVVGALLLEISYQNNPGAGREGRWLSFFLWMGAISYPLYLVHFGISERILRRFCSLVLGLSVGGAWGVLALVATSFAVASLMHIFVEEYFIRAGKYLISIRKRPAGTPPARPTVPTGGS
jgi:peptidoglycan/LPS O-acetylase OafA/YrhL